CSDGSYLDDDILVQEDEAGVRGANEVLCNAATEAAVLETARGNMANTGIAFERVDVGVCLNIAEDHLGYHGIETLDQMAVHKRQVIERATRAVVLNAEDPRCVAMRDHTDAKDLVLFASDPGHPEVVSHLNNNGCAVVVDAFENEPTIVLKTPGVAAQPVIAVGDIPATGNGAVMHNVYNALAATGIAYSLGTPVEHIAAGLGSFAMGIDATPGRLNEIPGFPFDVLVDAAHNPHGMRALVAYLDQRKVSGKRILVIGVRKFFSHEAILRCAAELAGHFDLYILRNYRLVDPFGPEENKALASLEQGLLKHGVSRADIIVEQDVLAAVDLGIEKAEKGDLLVVQVTAGGNHKWQLIDRIKGSARRADTEMVKARAVPVSASGPGDKDMKLLLCGDVMLGRGIDQVLPRPGDPKLQEHWRKVYDAREFIRRAQMKHGQIDKDRDAAYVWGDFLEEADGYAPDLRLVNLETAITAAGRAWPQKPVHFRMNPQNIDVLKTAKIDFCALANNHVMDWGQGGLEETIRTLDLAGIAHAGAGSGKGDAESPAILPVPGKGRVIVMSMGTASSGIPGAWAAGENRAGLNMVELHEACIERIRHLARGIRQAGDILVASVHWGGNYEPVVPQNQRQFARRLIDDAGVDIVHGHSSHHVRGIELHDGKLILYGCGDLVNDYEGMEKTPQRQALAPDLGLMYFTRVSPADGRVTELQMVPVTMRRLRITRGSGQDAERLKQVLNRECLELGTVVVNEGGVLHLKVMTGTR
ncbi:MAG: CapA family protein, partial [Lysobacterales bacterium]